MVALVFLSLWLAFPASLKPLSDSSVAVPPVFAAFNPPGDYTWEYNCGNPREVEIIGAGMGSEAAIENNPQNLTITSPGTVDDLWVQAFVINPDPVGNTYLWPSVDFSSSAPDAESVVNPNTEAGGSWHYETDELDPASQITAEVIRDPSEPPPLPNIPRSFIAYLFRDANPLDPDYNTGELPHKFILNGQIESETKTFTILQTTSTRSVNVTFAVSDKRSSAEWGSPLVAEVKVEIDGAPSLTTTRTYNEPTNGNQLLLDTVTINNVPGWADTVKVTVRSPDDDEYGPGSSGDSLYWSGVNVQTSCANLLGTCDSADFAPANKFQACYYQFSGAPPPDSNPDNYEGEYPLLNKEDEVTTNFTYGPPPQSRVQSADPAVDRNWPGEIDTTGQSNNVVGVWRGSINFQSGIYDFFVETDDGARVTVENINGVPGPSTIINGWSGSGSYSALNQMVSSGSKKVTLQWYNVSGNSRINFWWNYKQIQDEPWLRVNGDVQVQGDLYSNVHMLARYFSTGRTLVSVKGTADFGGYGGMVERDGKWLIEGYNYDDYPNNTLEAENLYGYDYFDQQIEATPWPFTSTPTISNLNALTDTFYKVDDGDGEIDDDLTLPSTGVWTIDSSGPRKLVILVNGDLTIQRNIIISPWHLPLGSFLSFIVKGDINIESGVSNGGNAALNGVYIADGQIKTSASNNRLTVMGTYIGYGGLIFQRTWVGMATPTESFFYDPTLIMQAPFELGRTPFVWQEVAP